MNSPSCLRFAKGLLVRGKLSSTAVTTDLDYTELHFSPYYDDDLPIATARESRNSWQKFLLLAEELNRILACRADITVLESRQWQAELLLQQFSQPIANFTNARDIGPMHHHSHQWSCGPDI